MSQSPDLRAGLRMLRDDVNVARGPHGLDKSWLLRRLDALLAASPGAQQEAGNDPRVALRQLMKESAAVVALAEPELREAIGHTNLAVFKLRIDEAAAVLSPGAPLSAIERGDKSAYAPPGAPEQPPCVQCGATESSDGDWYRLCGPCHWKGSPGAPDTGGLNGKPEVSYSVALPQGRDPLAWQLIDTAPKDETDVLTFGPAGRVVARYEDGRWVIYNYGYEDATVRKWPTHWMPLPDPPRAALLVGEPSPHKDQKDDEKSATRPSPSAVSGAVQKDTAHTAIGHTDQSDERTDA